MPAVNGREVRNSEWNLMFGTNGVTLRTACIGEGLPCERSATNRQLGARLAAAGFTDEYVREKYGWRARAKARGLS